MEAQVAGLASYGSIGYWLKPEFSDQPLHEEGAVGAIHGEEAYALYDAYPIGPGRQFIHGDSLRKPVDPELGIIQGEPSGSEEGSQEKA